MKDSNTKTPPDHCPFCLQGVTQGRCDSCGGIVLTSFELFDRELKEYTIEECLFRSPSEELLRGLRDGEYFLIRRLLKPKEIELTESEPYGVAPAQEGYFEGTPFMVWPWPEKTLISSKGMSPGRAVAALKQVAPLIEQRLEQGGSEPLPWEVVYTAGRWSLLTGWERVVVQTIPESGSLAAPERLRGGARSRESRVYTLGATLYAFATGDLPMGLLSPPSKSRHNCTAFDLVVARALRPRPADRLTMTRFNEDLERSLGIKNPVGTLFQYAGAALGLLLLAGVGYGVSLILSSL